MSTILIDFVKEATKAGKSRSEINAVLKDAGWSGDQLNDVWKKFHDSAFPILVPLPTAYASPRLAAINLFYCIVLYITLYSAVSILFTFLDYILPERTPLSNNGPFSALIRYDLAILLVSAPLLFISARLAHRMMETSGQFIPAIRLKLLSLTLLFVALVMLCDVTTLVYYLLSGDFSMRFIIKIAVIAGVCIGVYVHFKPELQQNEAKA